ncbi:MAG: nucleoside deaminase [Candidatus Aminicenantes bacterium]|nr:nucleoside deaminase [Candidatus Aminicenantes bacterium]
MSKSPGFMARALAEARLGVERGDGGPFGALIVQGNRIISCNHNEVLVRRDPTAHAEILAIRAAALVLGRPHLTDCVLYTTCEPCPMCLGAAAWARIPRLFYGCTRNDAEKIGFSDRRIYALVRDEPDSIPLERISLDRRSCLRLFTEWRLRKDSVLY